MKLKKENIEILDVTVTVIGIIMIGIGLFMIYPPVMFVIIGGILSFPTVHGKKVK